MYKAVVSALKRLATTKLVRWLVTKLVQDTITHNAAVFACFTTTAMMTYIVRTNTSTFDAAWMHCMMGCLTIGYSLTSITGDVVRLRGTTIYKVAVSALTRMATTRLARRLVTMLVQDTITYNAAVLACFTARMLTMYLVLTSTITFDDARTHCMMGCPTTG